MATQARHSSYNIENGRRTHAKNDISQGRFSHQALLQANAYTKKDEFVPVTGKLELHDHLSQGQLHSSWLSSQEVSEIRSQL